MKYLYKLYYNTNTTTNNNIMLNTKYPYENKYK